MTLQELLVPGNILTLFCDFTNPQKPKLLILVCLQPQLGFFIINSNLNEFMEGNDEVRQHQVQLVRTQHPFLKYDSWADCFKVIRHFDAQEIAKQLQLKTCRFEGVIHNEARTAIRTVVKDSWSLERRFIDGILQDLKDLP